MTRLPITLHTRKFRLQVKNCGVLFLLIFTNFGIFGHFDHFFAKLTIKDPLRFSLEQPLDATHPVSVNVYGSSGKLEVSLKKATSERWSRIGRPLAGNEAWTSHKDLPQVDPSDFPDFLHWKLASRHPITRDVDHYILEPPSVSLFFSRS